MSVCVHVRTYTHTFLQLHALILKVFGIESTFSHVSFWNVLLASHHYIRLVRSLWEIEAINLLIQASLVSMCCTCFRSLPRNRALAVSSLSSVSLSNRIDLSNLFSTRPVSLPECSLFYFHANTYTHTHTCAHIHIHYNTYSVFYMWEKT